MFPFIYNSRKFTLIAVTEANEWLRENGNEEGRERKDYQGHEGTFRDNGYVNSF